MKKNLLYQVFFIAALLFVTDISAQQTKAPTPDYKSAIGFRFFPFGISFKTNSDKKKTSFELNGYFRDGFTLSGLHEWNFKLSKPGNLHAYLGFGGHVGFFNEKNGGGAYFGIDGVVGLDYKFLYLPIDVSADWQPNFQFGKSNDFNNWGGVAVRFTL